MSLDEKISRYGIVQVGIWMLVSLAAVNWGTAELLDVNLLTYVPGEFRSLVVVVIAAAGVVNLVETATDVEVVDA
ncbi:hypothetical protein [Halorarius halobius]|uniref:hypothetical protein n=1 Tax=Halorarius halobius TaxID=2962671 RepID=UPI0020CE59D6|nr:hypothetical protein [Halorarius halobius]